MATISNEDAFPLRVEFDGDGPRIGQVCLLRRTRLGFLPRPSQEIATLCRETSGHLVDKENLDDLLRTIASAMNVGDLALAAIASGRLSVHAVPVDLEREGLSKAAVDDPKHPGYPAGEADGKGGQYRPKETDESGGIAPVRIGGNDREQRIKRLSQRRTFRSILGRVLTARRVLRMIGRYVEGEIVQDIPVVNDVVGAASLADDFEMMTEMSEDVADSEAAIAFAKQGPVKLSDLQQNPNVPQSFGSFDAFKKDYFEKRFGPAGDGYDYHHLVEQGPNFGIFPPEQLQSTENIVRIPRLVHEDINSFYAKTAVYGGKLQSPRDFLRGKSFAEQRDFAIEHLQQTGAIR